MTHYSSLKINNLDFCSVSRLLQLRYSMLGCILTTSASKRNL